MQWHEQEVGAGGLGARAVGRVMRGDLALCGQFFVVVVLWVFCGVFFFNYFFFSFCD